jgi:ABC-type phosphate/phosphonate transport system ATPase subunit
LAWASWASKETTGTLSEQQNGFHLLRSIHNTVAPIILMMEDVKMYNKDIYTMCADFKGTFNAADHNIMFKNMQQLGIPPTVIDKCEQLYGASTTNYTPPLRPHPIH